MKTTLQDSYFRMTCDVDPQLGYKNPVKMDEINEKYKTFSPRNVVIPLDKETIIFRKNQMLHSIDAYDLKINQVKSMSIDGKVMPSIKLKVTSYGQLININKLINQLCCHQLCHHQLHCIYVA